MKEKINVQDFVEEFLSKKIVNSKVMPDAVERFIREKLDIVEYLSFNTKVEISKMVINKVVREENGIKKVDSTTQFLSFITAMLISHTNLDIIDPAEDYDALSMYGLLEPIISMFKKDYTECEALLKSAIADELVDNDLNVVVSKFLNQALNKLDGVVGVLRDFAEKTDLSKLLGNNIKEEDMTKFLGLLNKLT